MTYDWTINWSGQTASGLYLATAAAFLGGCFFWYHGRRIEAQARTAERWGYYNRIDRQNVDLLKRLETPCCPHTCGGGLDGRTLEPGEVPAHQCPGSPPHADIQSGTAPGSDSGVSRLLVMYHEEDWMRHLDDGLKVAQKGGYRMRWVDAKNGCPDAIQKFADDCGIHRGKIQSRWMRTNEDGKVKGVAWYPEPMPPVMEFHGHWRLHKDPNHEPSQTGGVRQAEHGAETCQTDPL